MAVPYASRAFKVEEKSAADYVHAEDICYEAGHTQKVAYEIIISPLGQNLRGIVLCVNV